MKYLVLTFVLFLSFPVFSQNLQIKEAPAGPPIRAVLEYMHNHSELSYGGQFSLLTQSPIGVWVRGMVHEDHTGITSSPHGEDKHWKGLADKYISTGISVEVFSNLANSFSSRLYVGQGLFSDFSEFYGILGTVGLQTMVYGFSFNVSYEHRMVYPRHNPNALLFGAGVYLGKWKFKK